MYRSTKHYGHEQGLSACFRQWRAESHCRFLHGYALAFTFIFEATELDERNWVVDFGALDGLKARLKEAFDHNLIVAKDDPEMDYLCSLRGMGLAQCIIMDRVGCEAFAEYGFDLARAELKRMKQHPRVKVMSCEVREHGANSAIYLYDPKVYGDRV